MITAFSYKLGNSFLHRCPALIKILFLPAVSIAVFMLPWQVAVMVVGLQTIAGFLLHLTPREQLCDLQAVLYYATFLIFAKLAGALFTHTLTTDFFTDFIPTLLLLLKLLCVMELAIRRFSHMPLRTPAAQMLALFICFIPQVSKNWAQSKKAWLARGGKKGLRMLIVLLPVLFCVGMKQAYNSARAITIRSAQ